MKRIFHLFSLAMIFAIIVSLVGLSTTAASAQSAAGALIQLSATNTSFESSQAVMVHVTISNPNPEDLRVLSWHTPANGVQGALFTVSRDGEPVDYLGALYKRAAPTDQDYITLPAGKSLEYEVNLSQYYSFAESDNYEIEYNTSSQNLYAASGSGKLVSNQLALNVNGRPDPVQKVIVPDVVTGSTTFNSCNATRQATLLTARNDASTYANNGKTYFNNNRAGSLYKLWFGTYNAARYAVPKSHFSLISTATDTATVNFDCTCNEANTYAYVYPNSPYNIYLCGAFWNAPATGTDSRAGTLIHEMSHFTILGGTDDYVYGQTGAKNLAISNPAQAIMNADNHEYFVENTPATADNAAAYTLGETSYNFGDQSAGNTSLAHTFVLTSRGDTNLSIGQLSVSTEFSLLNDTCSNKAVSTGNTCTFGIAFAPASIGAKTGTVTVPSNAVIATSIALSGNGISNADTTAPETSITSQPSNPSNDNTPTFTFSGNDGAGSGIASFQCKVDGSSYAACTSPYTSPALADGLHTFYVYAIDNAANADATPATYSWTVDTAVPAVTSITRASANPTNAASVTFTVIFSEAVSGVAPADFVLNSTGAISGATIDSVSGSGTTYTVTVSTGTGSGTLRLDIPNTATIADLAGNPLAGLPYTSGQVYNIDETLPAVTSITRASANPTNAASVTFSVVFSEAVSGVAVADFALNTSGTISGATIDSISGSSTTYTVTVSTGTGSGTIRLDIPNTATIVDALGNALTGLPYQTGEFYSVRIATFADVPVTYWAWSFVEQLYAAGVTGGCGTSPLIYCPDSPVTREQMAVFLLKSKYGPSYTPPTASGAVFSDVPLSSIYAPWIEKLASEGITAGCGDGSTYCPEQPVTRAQMAVFLLKSKYGAAYSPADVTDTGFADVAADYWAAKWIKQLANEGITAGCGDGNYCPEKSITRAEMAVFLVKTFELP